MFDWIKTYEICYTIDFCFVWWQDFVNYILSSDLVEETMEVCKGTFSERERNN